VRLGTNLRPGHLRQEHSHLPMDTAAYRYLLKNVRDENAGQQLSDQAARDLAGAFLVSVAQQDRPLAELSGGVGARALLACPLAGAFLFSGAQQDRPLGELSGGERSRAVLAGLLASAKNLLILDEPTNHLDIPSAERLEEALSPEGGGYEGTLILISHDRALIDATCDHLIVLDGAGNAEVFTGNYTEWTRKQAERAKAAQAEDDA